MNIPLFTGACTALVTPFINGKLNLPMLDILLQRQIDAGLEAVVLCGTTGESPTLTDEEKLTLIRRAKEYAGERIKLIAGTGSNSTDHTVQLSLAAQEAGADALLLVSPYYNKPTAEGLFRHYMTVAHTVRLPIILYNVPGRTGVDIPVSVYRRLARIPNIVGVKEASGDLRKLMRIREACGSDLTVWTGNDADILPAMALGAQGVISVLSNLYPAQVQALTDACLDGDYSAALDLQQQLQPMTDALFLQTNPIPVKAAMQLLGYDAGHCRLPLTQADEQTLVALKRATL